MAIHGRIYKKNINNILEVTYTLSVEVGGIRVLTESQRIKEPNQRHHFNSRRFNLTNRYSSYNDLVIKIENYYKLTKDMIKC